MQIFARSARYKKRRAPENRQFAYECDAAFTEKLCELERNYLGPFPTDIAEIRQPQNQH